jgi:anti-anti-sigma regulatory factor
MVKFKSLGHSAYAEPVAFSTCGRDPGMDVSPVFASFELRLGHNGAGAWNVTLAGELDALTSAALLGAANAIPQEAPVEINAADLTFCDSAGLRVLIQLAESRRVKPVTLRDPCLTLALLLRYVNVEGVFDVRPSQELSAATN